MFVYYSYSQIFIGKRFTKILAWEKIKMRTSALAYYNLNYNRESFITFVYYSCMQIFMGNTFTGFYAP